MAWRADSRPQETKNAFGLFPIAFFFLIFFLKFDIIYIENNREVHYNENRYDVRWNYKI